MYQYTKLIIIFIMTGIIGLILLTSSGLFSESTINVAENHPEITPIVSIFIQEPTVQPNNKPFECINDNYLHFPVNKIRPLPSDFTPSNLTSYSGYQLRELAKKNLENLIADARNQGVNIRLVSGYRSYSTQNSLFYGYVNKEMSQYGLNREQAIAKANRYSAKPGHSEHQLGTTVDLTCSGCTAFDFSPGNQQLYDFLMANAHKFGFAVSYPIDMTDTEGYIYEPWHIRFIGEDAAEAYYEARQENANLILDTFLKQKCGDKLI